MSASGFGAEAVFHPEPRVERGPGPRESRRGLLVTFEGIEGSGKTTQIAMLSERIKGLPIKKVLTWDAANLPWDPEYEKKTVGIPLSYVIKRDGEVPREPRICIAVQVRFILTP